MSIDEDAATVRGMVVESKSGLGAADRLIAAARAEERLREAASAFLEQDRLARHVIKGWRALEAHTAAYYELEDALLRGRHDDRRRRRRGLT